MAKLLKILCFVATFLSATPALALLTLTGFGGSYVAGNESGMFGGEAALSVVPMFDFGAFYEFSQGGGGTTTVSRNFAGGVVRFHIPDTGFFVDTRAGYHWDVDSYGYTLTGLYVEGGAGYSFFIIPGLLAIQPRIGVDIAETNGTFPFFNASAMLSLSL